MPKIKCQKFSVSSQCARLNQGNSHSRLDNKKMTLADLWLWGLGPNYHTVVLLLVGVVLVVHTHVVVAVEGSVCFGVEVVGTVYF